MDRNVVAVAATADRIGESRQNPAPGDFTPEAPAQSTEPVSDLRLVIEMDESSGCYVYKTIDRTTGEVVAQLPREDVLRLRVAADYQAGAVFKASI